MAIRIQGRTFPVLCTPRGQNFVVRVELNSGAAGGRGGARLTFRWRDRAGVCTSGARD